MTVVPLALIAESSCHDAGAGVGVEVSGRLVRQQDRRLVDDGAGHRHALLLTARELVRESALLAGQADHLQDVGHGLLDEALALADHLQGERDVVEDGLVGQQPEVLEHHAEVAPEVRHLAAGERVELLAEHVDLALGGLLLLEHEAEEARLAGTRRAHQEDELPLQHLEAHAAECWSRRSGIRLGDLVETNHGEYRLKRPARRAWSDTPGPGLTVTCVPRMCTGASPLSAPIAPSIRSRT